MRFSREPVVLVQALIVPLALAVVLLFHWPNTTVGVVNTLIVALGGAVAALGVSVDALLPLLAGLSKAVLAVILAFGLNVPENVQVFVLSAVGIVVAFLTRPQVTAKTQASLALAG